MLAADLVNVSVTDLDHKNAAAGPVPGAELRHTSRRMLCCLLTFSQLHNELTPHCCHRTLRQMHRYMMPGVNCRRAAVKSLHVEQDVATRTALAFVHINITAAAHRRAGAALLHSERTTTRVFAAPAGYTCLHETASEST